jgi:hypothetical protein
MPVFFVSAQWTASGTDIYNSNTGNVGIGTTTPSSPLSVVNAYNVPAAFTCTSLLNTRITIANTQGQLNLGIGTATPHAYAWSSTGSFFIGDDGSPTFFVQGMFNGSVGIGTMDTKGYKFAVNGSAIFNQAVVKLYSAWPDYVFHPGYPLRPLNDLARYIRQERHLPDLPSAADVQAKGVDLGQNQAALLKKVEELTLYIIDMQKENDKERKQIRKLIESERQELQKLRSQIRVGSTR